MKDAQLQRSTFEVYFEKGSLDTHGIMHETLAEANHSTVEDKVAQEEEESLLQAAILTISDLGFRLDESQMVSRVLAEENDKLTAELAEARASRTQLESKVRELEATLSEWENGGEEAWQEEEQSWVNLDDPTAEEELTRDSTPTQNGY